MTLLDESPFECIMNLEQVDTKRFAGFVHRTFNATDLEYFLRAIQNIYKKHGGLEAVFTNNAQPDTLQPAIHNFRKIFFELDHLARTEKQYVPSMDGASRRNRRGLWDMENSQTFTALLPS